MFKIFGEVDLIAPSLGDIEVVIPCSFDFDLKKKNLKKNAHLHLLQPIMEDNQTFGGTGG